MTACRQPREHRIPVGRADAVGVDQQHLGRAPAEQAVGHRFGADHRDGTRNWTPGRINMVLILTDGADDDVSGISRAELLRQLRGLVDRKRPLPILFIGVGKEIDPGELQEIAKVTGGRVALTAQPSGIRQIFFSALSEFSCLPPRCRR
jgi:hypothetical protein